MVHRTTKHPGYGGDVLIYKENKTTLFAIHRVWTLNPAQHRLERLASGDPAQRRNVTGGCINVAPDVYEQLLKNSLTEVDIVNDSPPSQ